MGISIIRDITIKAKKYLDSDEILVFVGARQSGKTTILKQLKEHLEEKKEKNIFFLNLEDREYLDLLNKSPKNTLRIFPIDLKKRNFLFVDEIQYLHNPTNFLKYLYDEHKGKVKLIVSGSSAFYIDKKFKDSLAGRKKIFQVNTLSFTEFLKFKNEDDLYKKDLRKISLSEKEKIANYYHEYMLWGGYPRVVLAMPEDREEVLREIAYSYIKKDIYESGIKQEDVFYKLFKILSTQVGNLVNASELANTLNVSKTIIDNYLYIMQKSFHIFLLKPFFNNPRKELVKMPKVYFMDLGLRNFFFNSFEMFDKRNDKGELLENAVFRQFLDASKIEDLRYWRNLNKNEVDFVFNGQDAYEVKSNMNKFRESDYKVFFKEYPRIDLSVITIDKDKQKIKSHRVYDVWEI